MPSYPHLSIFTALPDANDVVDMDVNPLITAAEHSTSAPGGFDTLRIGFADKERPGWGFLPDPIDIQGMEHVVWEDGGFLCAEGRVITPKFTGGEIRGFESRGYAFSNTALGDGWYDNTSLSTISSLALLQDILVRCCPFVTLSPVPEWSVDAFILHTPNDYYGKMAHDLVDMLAKESVGGQSADIAAPFDLLVYENRVARWLQRIAPPRDEDAPAGTFGPTYQVDFDSPDVDWDPDFSNFATDVTVFYTVPGGSTKSAVTKSDTLAAQRYGVVRRVSVEGGTRSDAQAAGFAQTYLAQHSRPQISATVRRREGAGVRLTRGGEQLPQCVRAGEWIQVGDQEPLYILTTRFDWFTHDLELQCGWTPPGFWSGLAVLQAAVRASQAGLNPNTGAPQ